MSDFKNIDKALGDNAKFYHEYIKDKVVRDFISDVEKCAERQIEQLFDIGWIDEQERKEAYDKLYGR